MLVIYHSRCSYLARQAAAIHAGRLPPEPPPDAAGLEAAIGALGAAGAMTAEGLWPQGQDELGHQVFGLGRASRPDVVHRAFHAMAEVAGVDSRSFRLQNVGATVAWTDLKVRALRWLGLPGLARRVLMHDIRRGWARSRAAVEQVKAAPALQPAPALIPAPGSGQRKIIYHCYGSAHSSVTAANLHLGNLPLHRRPGLSDIFHQPLFDRTEDYQIGNLRYMGADEWSNDIYVLGLAGGKAAMRQALLDFVAAGGADTRQFRLEDSLRHAGLLLRIGGYTSRRLGWVAVGRPLCALGVWLKYPGFARHVGEVRRQVSGFRQQPSP